MRDVVIAGAYMTRFGKFLDRTTRSLVSEAVRGALRDAMASPDDVEWVYFGNALGGIMENQESIRGQVWLSDTDLAGLPTINVENACASGGSAVHQAWLAVASGLCDVAIAVGAEKLHHEDKHRAFAALSTAVDQERLDEIKAELGVDNSARSMFMDVYARFARDYTDRSGATQEDFARVAAKNHEHGALNPKAQHRTPVTVDEVLESRLISDPLTLLMCAPIGDGAAAVIVTTPAVADRWGAQPVRVLATAIGTSRAGGPYGELVPSTAHKAYEMAGIGPSAVDLVECHDATAPAELIVLEELGLCGPGEAIKLNKAGETSLNGRLPVNPSGGLESKGHPVGASGVAQVVELCDQLRDRCSERQVAAARVAIAENAGGYLGPDAAVAAITILGRAD